MSSLIESRHQEEGQASKTHSRAPRRIGLGLCSRHRATGASGGAALGLLTSDEAFLGSTLLQAVEARKVRRAAAAMRGHLHIARDGIARFLKPVQLRIHVLHPPAVVVAAVVFAVVCKSAQIVENTKCTKCFCT